MLGSKKLQRLAPIWWRDVAGQWFANPHSCPRPLWCTQREDPISTTGDQLVCKSSIPVAFINSYVTLFWCVPSPQFGLFYHFVPSPLAFFPISMERTLQMAKTYSFLHHFHHSSHLWKANDRFTQISNSPCFFGFSFTWFLVMLAFFSSRTQECLPR